MTGVSTVHIIQSPKHSLKVIVLYDAEENKTESESMKRLANGQFSAPPLQQSHLGHLVTYFVLTTAQGVGS